MYSQPGRKDSDQTVKISSASTPAGGRTCNGRQASPHVSRSTSATIAFMQILAQPRRRLARVLCDTPPGRLPPPGALLPSVAFRSPGALPPLAELASA